MVKTWTLIFNKFQIVNDFLIMRNRVLNKVFVFINKMVFKDCSG